MEDAAGGYWSKYSIADNGNGNGVCQLPPGKIYCGFPRGSARKDRRPIIKV